MYCVSLFYSFGVGWGEAGYIRVEMTGDQYGPCGMYTYAVAPSLTFRRPPPNLLPAPPPKLYTPPAPPQVPAGSGKCLQDPPECYAAYLYGAQYGMGQQAFIASTCKLSNVSKVCPCWCLNIQPPSPPSPHVLSPAPPPKSWQSTACPSDRAKMCTAPANNATILAMCAKNTTFRAGCPCICQVMSISV